MAKRKVVVKRLNAIQNFGAMDILCTDKTGTLTQDRIILEHHIDVNGKEDVDVLDLAWINSHHLSGLKNLLDVAVIRFAQVQREVRPPQFYKKIDELPFDFVRRRMSVIMEDFHGCWCARARSRRRSQSRHLLAKVRSSFRSTVPSVGNRWR